VTAERLGLDRKTLYRKLKQWGMNNNEARHEAAAAAAAAAAAPAADPAAVPAAVPSNGSNGTGGVS
jgi:hypothetical protein